MGARSPAESLEEGLLLLSNLTGGYGPDILVLSSNIWRAASTIPCVLAVDTCLSGSAASNDLAKIVLRRKPVEKYQWPWTSLHLSVSDE
jgi:hypothetical protein